MSCVIVSAWKKILLHIIQKNLLLFLPVLSLFLPEIFKELNRLVRFYAHYNIAYNVRLNVTNCVPIQVSDQYTYILKYSVL